MHIKTQYVGICDKCGHDVFVEVFHKKLDLTTSCECINSRVVRRSWWSTYVYGPAYWKTFLLVFCMIVFNEKITELVGICALLVFLSWVDIRRHKTVNKVYSIEKDGWECDSDLIIRLLEGFNHGKNDTFTTRKDDGVGTRDSH